MNTTTETYIPYIPDSLIREVGMLEAMIACKVPTFADETGTMRVSIAYLAELWDVDKRRIKTAADNLQNRGILMHKSSMGRGVYTEWQKGANFDTFMTLKKVQNLQKKGTKNVPYNKDIINNNTRASARRVFERGNNSGASTAIRKGKRLSYDEYYKLFGDTLVRAGWKHYKPIGYDRFIFEKL